MILRTLGLILLLPVMAQANYEAMDRAQIQLENTFQETGRSAGSPEKIRDLIRSKNGEELKKSIGEIQSFFSSYDQFNMNKIDVFMQSAQAQVEIKLNEFRPFLKKRQLKKLDKEVLEIKKNYNEYQIRKSNLGKENDFERVVSGRDFFNNVGNFSNHLKEAMGDKANRVWGTKLLPFVDNTKEFVPVLDDFLQLLYSSYFRTTGNKPNQAPIIDALRNISQKIAENKGLETKWFGLENLQSMPLDGETVNIFVFMHANSFLDTSVQGTLKLDGLSSIGNVDVIFPKFLANRMIKSDHIITVGHGDILAKTENLIKSKQLNKFFIAPEGMTPVGFYEMRPMIDLFTESVYSLIERGLKINLYPVSFPENFRFMNDYRRPIEGNKLAYGIVHPLLNTEELLQILKATGNRQAAAHVIRWIWFNELKNDADHNMGMPKPSEMKNWYDGMVWGNL